MMRFGALLIAAGLSAASLPAFAVDITQAARFGAGAGRYGGNAEATAYDPGGTAIPGLSFDVTNVKLTYGGELGYTFGLSDFYADLGVNFLRVKSGDEDNWRTDLLFTLGYYLTDNWSLFAGLRRGWQGEGVFDDETFSEFGPYIGFGYGGIPLGSWGTMNTSFAYNFDKAEDFPIQGEDFSYPGISLKLGMNLKGTPHSVQLRAQYFSGDDTVRFADNSRIDYELTETWAVLSYVFTLGW